MMNFSVVGLLLFRDRMNSLMGMSLRAEHGLSGTPPRASLAARTARPAPAQQHPVDGGDQAQQQRPA